MKMRWKRTGCLLICLMMLLSMAPVSARANDMVYYIESEEDFYAIMEQPDASYRLETDLDLGVMPMPLGGDTNTWFSGSIDGNGHAIRYSLRDDEGGNAFGLFHSLSDSAQITNLTLYPDIQLDMPEDCMHYEVAPICAAQSGNPMISGVTVEGSILITGGGTDSSIYVANLNRTGTAGSCVVDVDVDMRTHPDTEIHYLGLSDGESYFCEVYGNVYLQGKVAEMYQLRNARDCTVSQNLEFFASNVQSRLDYKGSFNYITNTLTVQPYPGTEDPKGWINLLSESVGSCYAGTVEIINCSPQFAGAFECEGVELDCDITAINSNAYMNGMSQTTDSVFRGDVSRYGGEASYDGLNNCQRCLIVGDIFQEAYTGGYTCFAINSSDCVVEGDIYTHSARGYAGPSAYGLSNCQRSSFTGDIHVVSDTSYATATGSGSPSCIVIGDLTAEGATGSSVQLVGDDSYYEGTVRAATVKGIGSGSSAKADIYAKEEVRLIDGSNSYFSGSVSMNHELTRLYAFRGSNNVANVNVNMNARGKWDTDRWSGDPSNTAIFDTNDNGSNNSFSGSVTIHANSGVAVRSDYPVTVHHSRIGSRNTGGIDGVWLHTDGYCGEECPGSVVTSLENMTYYQRLHYLSVISVSSDTPNVSAGDASAGWDGSIDMEGRYEPEREPANYTIQLTDMLDMPVPGAKLILGGASYITDDGGYVDIEKGPGVISPLEVQLKNADGEYETVLTRAAAYPIPNRVNVIRLEPVVDLDITFLASEDAKEGTGTASGGSLDIAGQKVPAIQFPLNVDVNGSLGKKLSFAYKWNPVERKMYVAISTSNGTTKYTKFDEDYYKKLVKDLQSSDYDTWSNANQKLQKAESIGTCMGFGSWKAKAMGFVEMQYTEEQKWHFSNSGFGVGASGELRGVTPISPFPGVYGTVAVTGSVDAKGNYMPLMESLINETKYHATAEFSLKGRVESAIGAGIRTARLYAEVGIGAELTGKLIYPWESTEKSLKLDAVMDAFGEVNCMIYSNRITFVKLPVQLWPRKTSAAVLSRALSQGEGFEIAPRNYAENAVMQTFSADSQSASYMGLNSVSSYPYAEVSLHHLGGDKYLLVYTDDDLSRESADRSALRACIGEAVDGELIWGEAVTVENDGTGDYGFAVATSGTMAAIIWQDATQTFGSGENIEPVDMAAAITLSQTILDCNGDVPVPGEVKALAQEGSMPYFPAVYYDGYTLTSAWVTSSNPDPSVYLDNETETVWFSNAFGAAGEAVAEGQSDISGIALLEENLYWTAGAEENKTLWMCGSEGAASELDSGNIMNLQSSGDKLCYTKDNALFLANTRTSDMPSQAGLGEGYENILRLSSDGNLYTAQLGAESSRICEIVSDGALPIGEYAGYVSSWDVCNGYIVTVVRSGFDETDTAGFTAEAAQQIEAMEVDELVWDNPEAGVGSYVNFTTSIFNDGYHALESLAVTITAADGTVLSSETLNCDIQPGDRQEISFGFTVPEGFTAQDVTVAVGDQAQTVSLGGSNLKVDARVNQIKPDGVTVKVTNSGLGSASGTIVVSDGSKTLYTGEAVVAEGETQSIWIPFDEPYAETTAVTVTLTESSGAVHTYDNEASVIVTPVKLKDLQISAPQLNPGESETLYVRAWPHGAQMPQVSFRSADERIATVDSDGRVTAIAPGTTEIILTAADGATYTTTVTVPGETEEPDPSEPDATDPSVPDNTEPSEPDTTDPSKPDNTKPSEPDTSHTHSYGDWKVVTEPTYLREGREERTCSCGEKEERSVDCKVSPFTDVPKDQYYYTSVLWAVENNITNGTSDTTFSPDTNCTRAQVVTFLWRAAGAPAPKSDINPFTDVSEGWYYDAVLWAVENGITNGTSDTAFSPDMECSRGQIVTFLWRAQQQPMPVNSENPFRDVSSDQYYYNAVLWAVENEITNGTGAGVFSPDMICTRGQIVTFLYRAMT